MTDTLLLESPVENIQMISKEARLQNQSHDILLRWIGGDFKSAFMEELGRTEHVNLRPRNLAELQGKLATVIDIFSQDFIGTDKEFAMASLLNKALFSESDSGSLINNGLGVQKEVVRSHIIGAISIATFAYLARQSGVNINAMDIIAPSGIDVKGKVDLILKFGDKNSNGQEIVRVVQLKAIGGVSKTDIRRPEDVNNTVGALGIGSEDAKQLITTCRHREWILGSNGPRDAEIRPFIVVVPGYDSRVVHNSYGKITDSEVISEFEYEAKAYGLLPESK